MSGVKIISLEVENVKRVQAVSLAPAENGLTIIGGDNGQGKSSVLDAIMSALGGESKLPSKPLRDGAQKGEVSLALSNGLTVHRTFTPRGSYLKVSGNAGGQSVLNEFVNAFALDLSTFLQAGDRERARILLNLVGLDLKPLEESYKKLYADREAIGRLATRARQHAEAMPFDEAAGLDLLTPSEIMDELQRKLAVNAHNENLRNEAARVAQEAEAAEARMKARLKRIDELTAALEEAEAEGKAEGQRLAAARRCLVVAQSKAESLQDENVSALKSKLAEIDAANARVRKNLEREKALAEAEGHKAEYAGLTAQMDDIKREQAA
ncbi:MAG: AAA family ATPase, partial [Lentisphaerae bacterium]|nr:AAA family ATPase [Lentisphaerota bacterium]